MKDTVLLGTCSWKYDSWRGLIYPEQGPVNYLKEYSYYYDTVEVDQWFWSLFNTDKPVLPKPATVEEYAASVPPHFTFGIKVPNSITLTHHYSRDKKAPLRDNPHFLSVSLFEQFLDRLSPLEDRIGPLIFQFEYLNKKKMAGVHQFSELIRSFGAQLPSGYNYCVETRNPNFLDETYFSALNSVNFSHVFLQGYYMPSIFKIYDRFKSTLNDYIVIRLLGPDRKKIEQQSKKRWNQIIDPRDEELVSLVAILQDLKQRGAHAFVFVNNHFEGSAPRTISKLSSLLDEQENQSSTS